MSKKERWKWIRGYEGAYSVSTLGRVYSAPRSITRRSGLRAGGPVNVPGRYMKTPLTKAGYPLVVLYRANKPDYRLVHRLVAEAFIPNPKSLPQVDHRDGKRANNLASNLRWSDQADQNFNQNQIPRGKNKYMGVVYRPKCTRRPWFAMLGSKVLGCFSSAGEAIKTRQSALSNTAYVKR